MGLLAAGMGVTSGCLLGKLLDHGIANLLCVESLEHGTNLKNYVEIRCFGGKPSHGGSRTGSTSGFHPDNTQGFFYVFKDSEFGLLDEETPPLFQDHPMIKTLVIIAHRLLASRMHAFLSGYNCVNTVLHLRPESKYRLIKILRVFVGVVGGTITVCVTPILKFRFSQIDPTRLQNDPSYSGAAYRTSRKIEAWRIGIIGSLLTGVNRDLPSRIKAHPAQFLLGIVQLTTLVAISAIATYAVISLAPAVPLVLAFGIPGAAGFVVG